jgi:hypothetical protein
MCVSDSKSHFFIESDEKSMSDDKNTPQVMAGLMLREESGFSKDLDSSFDEEEEAAATLVEEQLLALYSKQLDQQPPHKRRPALKKAEPLLIHKPYAYPCLDTNSRLPSSPTKWPQRPVSAL